MLRAYLWTCILLLLPKMKYIIYLELKKNRKRKGKTWGFYHQSFTFIADITLFACISFNIYIYICLDITYIHNTIYIHNTQAHNPTTLKPTKHIVKASNLLTKDERRKVFMEIVLIRFISRHMKTFTSWCDYQQHTQQVITKLLSDAQRILISSLRPYGIERTRRENI